MEEGEGCDNEGDNPVHRFKVLSQSGKDANVRPADSWREGRRRGRFQRMGRGLVPALQEMSASAPSWLSGHESRPPGCTMLVGGRTSSEGLFHRIPSRDVA